LTFGQGTESGIVMKDTAGLKLIDNIHDRETESRLWREFNSHFSSKNRERGQKVNHHDFIDINTLSKEPSGFGRLSHNRFGKHDSTYEGFGGLEPGVGDTIFGGPSERL
jgi:hypothetical protein